MNTDQFVDGLIEEEKLNVQVTDDSAQDDGAKDNQDEATEDTKVGDEVVANEGEQDKSEDEEATEDVSDSEEDKADEAGDKEVKEDNTASKVVEESRTLIGELTAKGLQPLDDKGNVRPFEEVLPPGAYLASHLSPVKVVDKEGKTHEFLLISDVEKAFPDGFEAKNNIEQLKFERGIMANETKFDNAIATYNQSREQYDQEVKKIESYNQSQETIAKEYRAMAEEGLVPKVGDPSDPKFAESAAVKELNSILSWMDSKNTELSKKGLGKIDSLYVAKQLMDKEAGVDKKVEKKQEIDKQRKEVASLSRTPTSNGKDKEAKRAPAASNMATFAEQLIMEEGL